MHSEVVTPEQRWELRARSANTDYVKQLDIFDGSGEWKWLLKDGLKHLPAAMLLLFLQRLTDRYDGELWQAFQTMVRNTIRIEWAEQERLFEALRTHYPHDKETLELAYYLYGRAIPLDVFETFINTGVSDLSLEGDTLFPILKEQSKQTQEAVELLIARKGWMTSLYALNKDFDHLDHDVAATCLAVCWRDDLPLYSSHAMDSKQTMETLQRIATLCVRANDVDKASALMHRIQLFWQEYRDLPSYLCTCVGTLVPFLMLSGYTLVPAEEPAAA